MKLEAAGTVVVLVGVVLSSLISGADAQGSPEGLAAADAAYLEGRLTDAMNELDLAYRGLSDGEALADWLERRALVCFALRDEGCRQSSVQQLASLRSTVGRFPPPLQAELAAARRVAPDGVVLEAQVEQHASGALVRLHVTGDPGGLVAELRVVAETPAGQREGEGVLQLADDEVPATVHGVALTATGVPLARDEERVGPFAGGEGQDSSTGGPSALLSAGIAVGGAGVALLAVALGTGLRAEDLHGELSAACGVDRVCPLSEERTIDEAKTHAVVSTVSTGIGLAALVAAGVLLLLDDDSPRSSEQDERGHVRPGVGLTATSAWFGLAGAI